VLPCWRPVWPVLAQPDEHRLTCGNPKVILTTYKSDVHPGYHPAVAESRPTPPSASVTDV
jgi:hypothetical protein